MSEKPSLPLPGVMRAPFVIGGFIFSIYLTGVFMATVTVGGWVEAELRRLGMRSMKRVGFISALSGVVGYILLGIIVPAWLVFMLIGKWLPMLFKIGMPGWPGLIIGPLVAMAVLARAAKW